MELILPAIYSGWAVVSLFTLTADVFKPKGFAGLFGAAASVAMATLGLTIANQGRLYAIESRSLIAGAAAFFCTPLHASASSE
jgi:hypothetical protein